MKQKEIFETHKNERNNIEKSQGKPNKRSQEDCTDTEVNEV